MQKKDIILLNAPLSNLLEKKIRPALVLAKLEDDLLVCFIGSKKRDLNPYEVSIQPDGKNKLRVDSVIKCNKLFTLHHSLVKAVLGQVSSEKYALAIVKITEIIR